MVATETYFQRVNRRLASARFYLRLASDQQATALVSDLQVKACIEAALLQLYYVSLNYLNELLECYRLPLLPANANDLAQLVGQQSHLFNDVHEFSELRRLLLAEGMQLASLCDLPAVLLTIDDEKPEQIEDKTNDASVVTSIPLRAVTLEEDLLTLSMANQLLEELQSLIERQRQNQVEF